MPLNARSMVRPAVMFACIASVAACAQKPPAPAPVASTPAQPYAPPPTYQPSQPMAQPSGPVPGSTQDFVINAGDRVYFDTNEYTVRADGRQTLDRQAQWLSRYNRVAVRVEGNCDERGTREYNFALGARRADAVKTYLVGRGVDPSRITTISYGKEKPLDGGTGEEAWSHNRNAHTDLTAGASQ